MFELIIIVFVFCVGYLIGSARTSYILRDLLLKEAERRGLTTKENDELVVAKGGQERELPMQPAVLSLKVEQINNVLYLYNLETTDFICQGSTIKELADSAQKYKNIKYADVSHGDNVYAFINGIVKTEAEVLKK